MLGMLKIIAMLKSMLDTFMLVVKDCSTSANGDYDPARVIGYGLTLLGALEFFILQGYSTYKTGVFDINTFSIGLVAVSGALTAAAAGVWIKKGAEIEPPAVVAGISKSTETKDGDTTVVEAVITKT